MSATPVEGSLVSPGARVAGVVRRSVLGPGVVAPKGTTVTDSAVFADTMIEEGARVSWSVVDTGCVVGADAAVGDPGAKPAEVAIVGKDSRVLAGVSLGSGARLEPGTTAGQSGGRGGSP